MNGNFSLLKSFQIALSLPPSLFPPVLFYSVNTGLLCHFINAMWSFIILSSLPGKLLLPGGSSLLCFFHALISMLYINLFREFYLDQITWMSQYDLPQSQ